MTLHFAYGSNMSRALMRRRCPQVEEMGPAQLVGWRFLITTDGYASVRPCPGQVVHGLLWRLSPRDRAAIDAYESLDSGLYRRRILPVRFEGRNTAALVYVARTGPPGAPKPGYLELVIRAAQDAGLPDDYIKSLGRFSRSAWRGARRLETGEVG